MAANVLSRISERLIGLPPAARYGMAAAAAGAGIALRLLLDPLWGLDLPYVTLYPAVALSSFVGGFAAGLATTGIAALATIFLWIEPPRSFAVGHTSELVGIFAFMAVGVFISALNETWRRAERERVAVGERELAVKRELDTAARHLQVALEAGRLGTWLYRMATGEVVWSPTLEAIHGLEPGTFPGTFDAFRDEIHPADRDRVIEAIREAAEGRRPHHVEYRIVRVDGAVRWVEGVGQVLTGADGRPDRMVGVCADVTERKLDEEQRARLLEREQAARAEMERASRLKDDFLAALSHELRTPLNAVLGYAHLLTSGVISGDQLQQTAALIERNARTQMRLVESLLDLSSIVAGRLELQLERMDLVAVVEAAIDVVRPAARARRIDLRFARPSQAICLTADAGRLEQVFWNLLSNAVKFTPEDGRVSVEAGHYDGHAYVRIEDNGRGIDPELLPFVFDRFRQVHGGPKGPRQGLGLGLSLVREMISAHGGMVSAESPGPGGGSTFTVRLPLAKDV